jgi:hypothetical protein
LADNIFTTGDRFETLAVTMLLWSIRSPKVGPRNQLVKDIAAMMTSFDADETEEFITEAVRRGCMKQPPPRRKKQ